MATQTAYTVRATYTDMAGARRAIATLERHGIPGSDIKLEGPGAEEAAADGDQADADERFMHEAEKSVLIGAGIGALAGMLIGVVGGLIWLGNMGIYLAAIAGLFGGGGLGFLVGAIARVQESDAAELTFGDSGGKEVVVALHTENREDIDKALEQLRDTDPPPAELESVDADGKPLDDA
ncbi:MAG TPA: hypothetical protein VM324_12295 [Egibacteraceae bacterium]|jgi:hypothetical protein|nr:hypothetical protein [Egibacteraceae bacterium]